MYLRTCGSGSPHEKKLWCANPLITKPQVTKNIRSANCKSAKCHILFCGRSANLTNRPQIFYDPRLQRLTLIPLRKSIKLIQFFPYDR